MDEARADFEQRGFLSFNEVIGPDGGLYHRPSVRGSNPVGDALQTIDARIRLMQAPPPRDDLLAMLPLIRLTNPVEILTRVHVRIGLRPGSDSEIALFVETISAWAPCSECCTERLASHSLATRNGGDRTRHRDGKRGTARPTARPVADGTGSQFAAGVHNRPGVLTISAFADSATDNPSRSKMYLMKLPSKRHSPLELQIELNPHLKVGSLITGTYVCDQELTDLVGCHHHSGSSIDYPRPLLQRTCSASAEHAGQS